MDVRGFWFGFIGAQLTGWQVIFGLLAEQRARLEEEVHNLKRQLAAKGDEHGGALQALKEQV